MKKYTDEDKEEIRNLLLWNRVEVVSKTEVIGPVGILRILPKHGEEKLLRIGGNEGCGGCSSGWYELSELNGTAWNAITAVDFEDSPDGSYGNGEGHYRIFVYCENRKIKLAEFEGSDGNGYYGTGYWIEVYE